MANLIRTVIQIRRAHTAEWLANKDVVPAAGEPCFDLDLNTLKIGNGVDTYEKLEPIGGVKLEVAADGKSIVLEDNVFKLMGFDAAEVGAQPRKNAEGNIEWVVPSTETVEGLKSAVAGLQSDVSAIQEILTPSVEGSETLLSRVESLETKMDGTGEGTVDSKIDAKIKAWAETLTPDSGKVDTLMELINYVETHGKEAANMAADIDHLEELVGEASVADQIAAAGHITKEEAEATLLSKVEAAATLKHVKFEITDTPVGTLVNYGDKEIRVMCPANAAWTKQAVGAGGDSSTYYMTFKTYAPNNAVGYIEHLGNQVDEEMLTDLRTDAYGRKYQLTWLGLAKYDEATGVWNYYGKNSTVNKYIGWDYQIDWYDANGVKIVSDNIRINLSNEACHNVIEPYYMANVVKEVAVNGTLLDVVDGKVNIATDNMIKSSNEIVVNEDGSLGVVNISIEKLVNADGTSLVLDGGGAAN